MNSIDTGLTACTQSAANNSTTQAQANENPNNLGNHSVKMADAEKTQDTPRLSLLTRIRDTFSITSLKNRLVRVGQFFQRFVCCGSVKANTVSKPVYKEIQVTPNQDVLTKALEKYKARQQELISARNDEYNIIERHIASHDLEQIKTSLDQILDLNKPNLYQTFIADANRTQYTINDEIIPKHPDQDIDKVKTRITNLFNELKLDIATQELISQLAHQGIFADAELALINNGILFGQGKSQLTVDITVDNGAIQLAFYNSRRLSKNFMNKDQQKIYFGSLNNWLKSQETNNTHKVNSASIEYHQQIQITRDKETAEVTDIQYALENPVIKLSVNPN